MIGITSVGAYIPIYRLSRDEIANIWGIRSLGGEKAVAGYDEDSVTMAIAAALDCVGKIEGSVDGLFFATTTAPYKEKQAATTIATAIDLAKESRTADYTDSLRASTIAMNSAIDAVSCDSAQHIILTASDCRIGAARSESEQVFGDGAAAITIGNSEVIATIEGRYSVFNEFIDVWRTDEDVFARSWEERFITTQGYIRTVSEVVSGLMNKYKLAPSDFTKVVFYTPDARSHINLARSLGFDPKIQLQDPLLTTVGNTGTAAPLLMLVAALEEAKLGDKILLASYGDGSDALVFNVTKNIDKIQNNRGVKSLLDRKMPISYEKYMDWRNLVPIEAPRRPENPVPSVTCLWRERSKVLALHGVRCKRCGTVQYPPQRICISCQAKDDFEDYKFANKKGRIFTYAADYLTPSKDPPSITAVVDFEGGGRMLCEMTDSYPNKIEIGMPVEMTFRKLYKLGGIHNYSWKARPITL